MKERIISMAHTNETPNYHLPQFVGTDIINPLVDTNGAYSAIDTALKDISDNEVTDAGKILALETTVGNSSAGLVKDVADLQTQNGDSVLTTDAQTLSAAINEVDAHTDTNTQNISTNAGNITDLQNTVGNANSGLVKEVNDNRNGIVSNTEAINALISVVGDANSGLVKTVNDISSGWKICLLDTALASVTADGVKTRATLLKELADTLIATTNTLPAEILYEIQSLSISGFGALEVRSPFAMMTGASSVFIECFLSYVDGNGIKLFTTKISEDIANVAWWDAEIGTTPSVTILDGASDVLPAGTVLAINGDVWVAVNSHT